MSKIIYFEKAESSNTLALELANSNNVPEFSIIWVGHQTRGRGQSNRKWLSHRHKNITMTTIVYPSFLSVEQWFYLSKISALATHELISSFCQNVFIKWPNDIYVNNKKISGILIENRIQQQNIKTSVVGVGINVNQQRFPKNVPNPTSLYIETEHEHDLKSLIVQWQQCFIRYYEWLKEKKFTEIDERYHQYLYMKNQTIRLKIKNEGIIAGKVIEVTSIGQLKIESNQQTRLLNVGEAEWLIDV